MLVLSEYTANKLWTLPIPVSIFSSAQALKNCKLLSAVSTNNVASVSERTIPIERPPFGGEVIANFADRGCLVVSATDPYVRIL
jgi:hypothetical protein